MTNQEIAKIFHNISLILEIKGENKFKFIAYEHAAEVITDLSKDLSELYQQGGLLALEAVPGVGESLASKIAELIKTGKLKYYQQLTKHFPAKVLILAQVPGVGPKTIKTLYEKLQIDSIVKLTKAAQTGLIAELPHFKKQTELNILRGIEQFKFGIKEKNRLLLSSAAAIAEEILTYLRKNDQVVKCEAGGSLRRYKETIGDIDIIVAAEQPQQIVTYFSQAPFIKNILAQGDTKISITHQKNIRVDLEILPPKSYGSLLQHFTGSKEHNVHLRTWAAQQGLKLSEYGIKDLPKKKVYHFSDEPSLYKFLGLEYIEPELREDRGEIEAALANKLPQLIGYKSLLGDLHCHTNKSDGHNTIAELACQAIKLHYKYLGISDHTVGLGVASGLDDKKLLQHQAEIARVNKKYPQLKLLAGAEINIRADGKLDISRKVINKLDYSIGSIHSAFNQDKTTMTKRLLASIKSGLKILGHPSGRLIGQRPAYDVDWSVIFQACAQYKVALEINSSPQRLDLKDTLIKEAASFGCKFVIDSDSHSLEHFASIKYGIATARRGWLTKQEVINAWPLARLRQWLAK